MTKAKFIVRAASVSAAILVLSACGGGGGGNAGASAGGAAAPAVFQGVFTDAPVAGLSYATSSGASGTTNSAGQFNYAAGDTVTFSVGGLTLGSAAPTTTSAGTAVVTPVSIVPGASDASNPKVTAIGQLLGTLNSIAVANNAGASGTFTMPANAKSLIAQIAVTDVASIGTTQLQSLVTAAGAGAVVSGASAQANMTQGINSTSVIGTTWSGTCTCGGGGTFYFAPDGSLTGFTADGQLLAGNWLASTSANGGIQISLVSSGGGYSKNGTIPAGSNSGSADIYSSSNALQGTFTFNKLASSGTLGTTLYVGGWYATYTPNATGAAAGDTGGQAYLILSPDGGFHGITDGANAISGTWDPASGSGSASFATGSGGRTVAIAFNAGSRSGTVSVNGTVYGALSLSRSGTLMMNKNGGAGSGAMMSGMPIPLALNVQVSWPANIGNVVSSFALALSVKDAGGNPIATAIKSEVNPLGVGAAANTTTDNIVASYTTGSAASYTLSVGPSNCSIAGGSGTVVDANSNKPSAYPTVAISCH